MKAPIKIHPEWKTIEAGFKQRAEAWAKETGKIPYAYTESFTIDEERMPTIDSQAISKMIQDLIIAAPFKSCSRRRRR